MTVEELAYVLTDYVKDGLGNMEVYFGEDKIKDFTIRIVFPPFTGIYEPYNEFVLLNKEKEE